MSVVCVVDVILFSIVFFCRRKLFFVYIIINFIGMSGLY